MSAKRDISLLTEPLTCTALPLVLPASQNTRKEECTRRIELAKPAGPMSPFEDGESSLEQTQDRFRRSLRRSRGSERGNDSRELRFNFLASLVVL